MNLSDTLKMIAVLKAAYPHSFKDMSRAEADAMVNLWARVFKDDNPLEVSAAIDALISTRTVGYSPTPGEVKEQINKVKHAEDLDAHNAWALVSKACANGLYGYREEFEKLPPQVQRAVGAPEQLKAWAMMDSETVESVVASNFMKGYRTIQQRDREFEKLPSDVKDVISKLSGSMGMNRPAIEESKQAVFLPMPLEKLERVAPRPMAPRPETKPEYKPPDPEEWEKKRAAAMKGFGL